MSDIFISYSSEERNRVLPLVNALGKTGWSVFWDRTIPAGKTWRQVIGAEIRTCRSVLVVWTQNSVTSEWVLEEAETGKRRGILIPVLLDDVEPPFGFGNIQAANLTAWNGDNSSPSFTHLVADIATILGPAATVVKEAGKRRRLDAESQKKAEEERFREQERQRSEEDARRKAEEENLRRIEEEADRVRLREETAIPSEDNQPRKESLRWLNMNKNDKLSRLLNVCHAFSQTKTLCRRSGRRCHRSGGGYGVVVLGHGRHQRCRCEEDRLVGNSRQKTTQRRGEDHFACGREIL